MRFLFSIIFFTISVSALSQVTADFNIPSEVCLDEQFVLDNTSINADSYEWDFCPNDINETPSISTTISNITSVGGYKIIEADSRVYVFVLSGNNLHRLEFDSTFTELQSQTDLGDFGLINNPDGIDIYKDSSGDWVGFIGHRNNGGGYIVRLVWSDIAITPLAENIGNLGQPGRIRDVKIVKDGTDYFGVFPYYNSSILIRANFGSSLKNTIEASDIINSSTLANVQFAIGMDIIRESGEWKVGFSSLLTKTISLYNLGTDITNEPTEIKSQSFPSLPNVRKLKFHRNYDGDIYAFWSTEGKVEIINLKEIKSTSTFELVGTDLPESIGIDYLENAGELKLISGNDSQSISHFKSECLNNDLESYSEDVSPLIFFSFPGTYSIELVAYENGNSSKTVESLLVSSNEAPIGAISLDSAFCIAGSIVYSFNTSNSISSYNWDFGDGNVSTDISPTHQYGSDGEYIISLEVESSDGCPNIFYDTLTVLPEPQPEFSTTSAEYCTFESIDFNNITPFDFGDNVVWSWDFNGEGSSTEENPSFIFESSGTKTITLEANVLGCVETYQSTLDIIDGPQPDFEYDKNCLGEVIQFNNLSSGANVTGYEWDFGNGEISTEANPQVTYNNAGDFTVELRVSNASGCENITTQNIQIFEEVVDSIYSTETTENLPFNLGIDWKNEFDSTQNLSFQWNIDGDTQTVDTATYILSQGTYTVNLEITTENNCLFNAQREIEVLTSEYPTPDFNIPSEVCLDEQFVLDNTSINADSYEWDFCPNDINETPSISTTISNITSVGGYKIIEADSRVYVFVLSGNNLHRLEFDSTFTELQSQTDLGDFGLINNPDGIDIYKDSSGDWVGFIGHRNNGGGYIVRLVWSDIAITPLAENIGNLGQPGRIRDVKIVKDGTDYFGVFPYYNSSILIRANFGSSLKNTIEASDIINSSTLANVQFAIGMDIIRESGEWKVGFSSLLTKTISLYNLGTDITNEPTEIKSQSFPSLPNVRKLKFHRNYDGDIYAFWSTEGKVEIINLKEIKSTSTFELVGTDLPESIGIDYLENAGVLKLISGNDSQSISHFKSECLNNDLESYSEDVSPLTSFSSAGTYPITLTAFHPNGNSASITKEITVTENQAPDISFSIGENLCISNPIQFESHSTAELNDYLWDFGDGEASTEANPNHTFASAGTYAVKLSVTDISGCNNLFMDSIRVFEEPVPDFQASAQGSVCSQKPIVFENLTNLPTEATFSWDFGDGNTSTEENPEHIYQEAGEYIVRQSINMAGCEVEKIDTISVNPGPNVAFQIANNCLGEILQFENTSQGEFLESFQWDFGDGTQSTQTNPNHLYDTAGTYQVQLTALTSNGCDFTISQDVTIQPLASVAFEAEVACANQPVQFSEQVNIAVSNITDYFWDFGVAGTQTDVSTEANPAFAFPASGSYNVRLQVTTSDGCTTDTTQTIIVNALPAPDFEFENSCINETRLFTPENTANITAHFWELQNDQGEILQSSQSENFSYLFDQAGSYQLTYRQENENLCSNAITKNFTINEFPEPDFAWGIACAGEAMQFENLTDLKGNNLKKYNWSIDGEVISTDALPQYTFEDSGDYLLSLQVETQGGCVQSISKEISISPAPTALFELTQNIGTYPFILNLNAEEYQVASTEYQDSTEPTSNFQLPTSNYLWTLNSDTISSSAKLDHIIQQPGTYLLGLIITNEAGCRDEHYEQIRVREPNLDVALSNLRINKDDEFTTFVLNITNRGSLVPERIDLSIDLGSYSVTESLETALYPESNRNFSLSLKLTDEQIRGLSKICISASPKIGEYADSNNQNNRICTNLESGFKVMDIYPNPAVNQFTIPLITPNTDQLTISMEDSNGRQVKIFNYDLEAGYNEIQIQRESLSPGIYFLRFRHQGQEKVKKIIFQ